METRASAEGAEVEDEPLKGRDDDGEEGEDGIDGEVVADGVGSVGCGVWMHVRKVSGERERGKGGRTSIRPFPQPERLRHIRRLCSSEDARKREPEDQTPPSAHQPKVLLPHLPVDMTDRSTLLLDQLPRLARFLRRPSRGSCTVRAVRTVNDRVLLLRVRVALILAGGTDLS